MRMTATLYTDLAFRCWVLYYVSGVRAVHATGFKMTLLKKSSLMLYGRQTEWEDAKVA
jgi:hypothetical protein